MAMEQANSQNTATTFFQLKMKWRGLCGIKMLWMIVVMSYRVEKETLSMLVIFLPILPMAAHEYMTQKFYVRNLELFILS